MKEKIEILARLLKEDKITVEEFMLLMPEKKEENNVSPWTVPYIPTTPSPYTPPYVYYDTNSDGVNHTGLNYGKITGFTQ